MTTTCEVQLDSLEQLTRPSVSSIAASAREHSVQGEHAPPVSAVAALERWNAPRANIGRTLAAFWSFLMFGMNDAAYGALLPYLESFYGLSYTIVSLVFLSPLVGYILSASFNHRIHVAFGQRGVAFLAPTCHLVAYVVNCLHPPYPVLVISFIFAGFGNGIADSAWNAWMGNLANANETLGLLHGVWGLGAVMSPLMATAIVTKAHRPWYYYYYVMIPCAAIEFVTCMVCFWSFTGARFRQTVAAAHGNHQGGLKEALFWRPYARVTWLCAIFLIGYAGIEVALGGWIVTFMMGVRKGGASASEMTATGFWLGITCGRMLLGFVTPRIGERVAISVSPCLLSSCRFGPSPLRPPLTQVYIMLSIACALVFWLVPQFYVSAVAVSFQGFFLGPLFPAVVVVTTKLLPRYLHVSSIGFAAAFGGGGGAVLPFAVGVIAQSRGVWVLQPFIIALSVAILVLWLGLPRVAKVHRPE
ncbi:uncharacterized protein CDV56_104884 [Aspergillus thermomutatus]|uniref:Major facilitator superfamily (MFS) profile domain-containing protein n=1 Tax=Aspergillus thermomutatus TaxID=41047 RepID=A0A397GQ46_ASPTH|nr:uncharacterized protein CDV56_104884 [Aspergillus thermomutatus]RHZ50160.1 hypothetical protein CDV56_104884 [Aspergillus thermomutatus]